MKKKFLKIVLSVFVATVCLATVSACGKEKHEHAFSEWQITKNATCTVEGEKQRTCSCGETETEAIEKVSHSGGTATCQQKAVCIVCGTEYGEYADHNFAEEYTVDSNPTCLLDGEKSRHCTVEGCGVRTDKETLYSLGHSFTHYESNDDATCTEDGTETAYCDREGCYAFDKRTKENSATGHTFGELIAKVEPTRTESGFEAHYVCSGCGHYFNEDKEETDYVDLIIPETEE